MEWDETLPHELKRIPIQDFSIVSQTLLPLLYLSTETRRRETVGAGGGRWHSRIDGSRFTWMLWLMYGAKCRGSLGSKCLWSMSKWNSAKTWPTTVHTMCRASPTLTWAAVPSARIVSINTSVGVVRTGWGTGRVMVRGGGGGG